MLRRTKSTSKLDISSAVRGHVILNLHESQYEGPSQKETQVVSDYRVCCFYDSVSWNYARNLCKTVSIVATRRGSRCPLNPFDSFSFNHENNTFSHFCLYHPTIGLYKKRPEPDYYKNLYTGEILSRSRFERFQDSIRQRYVDSLKRDLFTRIHFYELQSSNDSTILPFKYDIRVDHEYVVRANSYIKVGTKILPQQFTTTDGDRVQIGGLQAKPTMVNLWFVGCRGCVEELPSLNKLQAKYGDKVNFIAITFDEENKVKKFLEQEPFNFKHITGAHDFINIIGTRPYPENIFIDKEGYIVNIEGGLVDFEIDYFESIIEKLLQ